MSNNQIHDPNFWDGCSEYETVVDAFTVPFAQRALDEAALPKGAYVLDVATGYGALAIAAARAGLRVLATDFSLGMVRRVLAHRLPNLEARQMDGQALDLPDASFDAAFSNFGVMLFPDWRAGLNEMARVVRPAGLGSVGTWKDPGGAAANLLLSKVCAILFPGLEQPMPLGGMNEFRDPDRFRAALTAAGFADVRIVEETNDYLVTPAQLDDPDRLFSFSMLWQQLDADRRNAALASIRESQTRVSGASLSVPSTALIATARRP